MEKLTVEGHNRIHTGKVPVYQLCRPVLGI